MDGPNQKIILIFNPLIPKNSGIIWRKLQRRNCTGSYLKACKDDLQISDVMEALRSHGDMDRAKEWNPINSRWISVCAHASGTISPTFTAGSMVASVPRQRSLLYSTPGRVILVLPHSNSSIRLDCPYPNRIISDPKKADLNAYCWNCEHYNRVFLLHYHELFSTYFKERSEYESELVKMILSQNVDQPVIGNSFAKADEIMNKYHIALEKAPPEPAAKKASASGASGIKPRGYRNFTNIKFSDFSVLSLINFRYVIRLDNIF